jgi:GNAT superfamily N-acetyltransferase
VKIVEVGVDQIVALADLREASGQEVGEAAIRQAGWRDRFVRYLRTRQARRELQCFAAADAERYVGMAIASLIDDYRYAVFGERRGYVNAVYVLPEYRAHGAGRALTQAAIGWLLAHGCATARLRPSPKAEALYRRMGFFESGELELNLRRALSVLMLERGQ